MLSDPKLYVIVEFGMSISTRKLEVYTLDAKTLQLDFCIQFYSKLKRFRNLTCTSGCYLLIYDGFKTIYDRLNRY